MRRREEGLRLRWVLSGALLLGLGAGAGDASANGRYPSAQQLVVDPGDPSRLWVRATYGILTSGDSGKTWEWLCETAVGFNPAGEDPMLGVTVDGKVFAATLEGLLATFDHGCDWGQNLDIGPRIVPDLAVEHDGKHVLALTSLKESNGNYDLQVFRSDDKADRFTALGPPISKDVLPLTIDPAPSDAQRLYVSGAVYAFAAAADAGHASGDAAVSPGDAPAVLLRSRDGGTTWERKTITGASASRLPYIAAIHPTNPDVLYVRVRGELKAFGNVESWLLYTEDAGDSWREIFRASAEMLGFALSADGTTVFVGMGDTKDSSRPVDAGAIGIYRAIAPGFAFEKQLAGQVGCLTSKDDLLYVCGSHESESFEIGVSTDQGATATPLFDFRGARGPISCPVSSGASQCQSQWPSVCGQVGETCSLFGNGGSGGAAQKPTPARGGGGCGCSSPGKASPPRTGLLEALALAGAVGLFVRGRQKRR